MKLTSQIAKVEKELAEIQERLDGLRYTYKSLTTNDPKGVATYLHSTKCRLPQTP